MASENLTETAVIDSIDRQILHCLRLDPRAGFRRIATVTGVSEQTVARRYRTMSRAGVVHVVGLNRPVSAQGWIVRLRCQPSASVALAHALAAREDVSWVNLSSGGTELVCATGTQASQQENSEAVLLEQLPRTKQVLDLTAHALLHRFAAKDGVDWIGFDDPLSTRQRDQLLQGRELAPPGVEAELGPADAPMMALLADDGRVSVSELARSCGWSAAKVRTRLAQVRRSGALQLEAEITPEALGLGYRAQLWMTARPSRLDEVGEAVIAMPEVVFAAALSGPSNLTCTVHCRNSEDLYRLVSGRLGQLRGMHRIEVMPGGRRFKQERTPVVGERLQPSRTTRGGGSPRAPQRDS